MECIYKVHDAISAAFYGVALFGFVKIKDRYVFEKRKKAHITFSGDHIPREESALVFSNHRSWIDYYMIHSVASRRNMLHNCKYFVKDSIKWLPFFGWGMWLAGFVFVRRNWTKDQKKIKKSFSKIKRMKTPVWIISYLEGSRFTTEKMIECQAFSKERGLPILQHVLTPRTKGFVTCVQEFRNSHVKCVYDFTIAYRHNIKNNPSSGFLEAPSMVRLHTRRLSPEYDFHVHVKRFMIDELPEEEDALSGWVMERYVEKDRFLASLKDDWLKGQEIDLCIK
ncbi:hypothetical protein PHYBLDRAFT_170692 [Phycomyces blakesleeanus NRRL 1555(-)]|uniref:Phospholipid/glycerol acyltransferase domain-containing protein n=1 Tax=Phycomyces blakesleeanus (strain ATCC 8743b / DSM 1359 / FGSC 10004 / NBRC 33097 / NRRL 1555) TaxID=763407 RepID=A0A162WX02_PHYB8|nr:hypothetical protein PHYBLDRAFT_170692 [Phycomyces blakesleeanus NRRL 1555(-)]OAD71325.1 hypothetical protein PHYBLDRAFT_170692 [Phycomyces blakesleeanus NRRL 1555(-)]|eukprot:XP_018289365.1 hypothetical protein PHYBLDRAFT_170692 [Phycomyces blakesleeanus NRRL 1555(-)]